MYFTRRSGERIRYKWVKDCYDFEVIEHLNENPIGKQQKMESNILEAMPEGELVKRKWLARQLEIIQSSAKQPAN